MSTTSYHPSIANFDRPLPYQRQVMNPRPQVEKPSGLWDQIGTSLGTGLGQGFGNTLTNTVQGHMRRSLVDKTLGMLNPQMSPLEKYGVISQLDPEMRKEVTAVMEGEQDQRAAQAKAQYEHDKELRGYQAAQDLERLKQSNTKAPQSQFAKKMDDQKAEYVGKVIYELAPAVEQSKGNIRRLEQLNKELSEWFYGSTLMNPAKRNEMNTLARAAIEPVLHLYNPVGAIPQAKIEMVVSNFAPSPWDAESTARGKIQTLKRITQHGENQVKKIMKLAEVYGDDIPTQELLKMKNESDKFMDTQTRGLWSAPEEELAQNQNTSGKVLVRKPGEQDLYIDPNDVAEAEAEGWSQ